MAYRDYKTHNQRHHYRINERVRIGLSMIPEEREKEVIDDIMQGLNFSSLARISAEFELALAKIPAPESEVRVALQALNRKLDMVIAAVGLNASGAIREQTINLSYGGCRLRTDQLLIQEAGVDVSLVLANSQRMRLFARVVDVKALSGVDSGLYEVAMQFQAMSDKAAAVLRKHIEDRQRKILQSRLRR